MKACACSKHQIYRNMVEYNLCVSLLFATNVSKHSCEAIATAEKPTSCSQFFFFFYCAVIHYELFQLNVSSLLP